MINKNCVHIIVFRVSSKINLTMFIRQFIITFVKVGKFQVI